MPKIVAMLRLKNEERWIAATLQALSEVCYAIVILDESTDNTLKICESFKKVTKIHRQSNLPFDETRDKNTLLKMALEENPDFILMIDGDEVLQPGAKEILFEELEILYPEADVFELQSLFMWDKPNQYRYDGTFSNTWQRRLLRMTRQPRDLIFDEMNIPGNAHCPPIPYSSKGWDKPVRSNVKILHYGYYDEPLRLRKYKFYTTLDPNNTIFDGYKHIISGTSKLSGPKGMEFRIIPDGMYIPNIN